MAKKTVLVTGSSRGIGKAIAMLFGKNGYAVVLNGSKDIQALQNTKNELTEQGIDCIAVLADVSIYEQCKMLFCEIEKKYGGVDILINNAGIAHIGLFSDMTSEQWKRVLSVNLESVLHCTHIALKYMLHYHKGNIINISSMWGQKGASCEAVYSASKGGVDAFTKAMAKELGPSGIRVNAISCGVIDTDMNQCFDEQEKQMMIEEISLMRMGKAEEVAKLALFLAEDSASFITGQIVVIDGGMI